MHVAFMLAVLIPFQTQHGVRSGIIPLASSRWDQASWRTGLNRRIDPSNCTWILHTGFQTRWQKMCHLLDRGYRWKFWQEILLTRGEMETNIWNLPQGNWSYKETWWNESGAISASRVWKPSHKPWRPLCKGRQTCSRKSQQISHRYGKVWWILSKTGPLTHAAR